MLHDPTLHDFATVDPVLLNEALVDVLRESLNAMWSLVMVIARDEAFELVEDAIDQTHKVWRHSFHVKMILVRAETATPFPPDR